MRKNNKLMCMFLVVVLCFSTTLTTVFAKESAVYSEPVQTYQGETVDIPIKISGNKGIMGIGLIITYDPSILKPIEATTGDVFDDGLFEDSIATSKDNTFKLIWSNMESVSNDGTLFVVKFKISDDAKDGYYKIGVKYSKANTFDGEYKDVELDCQDIDLTVGNPNDKPTSFLEKIWEMIVGFFRWIANLFNK